MRKDIGSGSLANQLSNPNQSHLQQSVEYWAFSFLDLGVGFWVRSGASAAIVGAPQPPSLGGYARPARTDRARCRGGPRRILPTDRWPGAILEGHVLKRVPRRGEPTMAPTTSCARRNGITGKHIVGNVVARAGRTRRARAFGVQRSRARRRALCHRRGRSSPPRSRTPLPCPPGDPCCRRSGASSWCEPAGQPAIARRFPRRLERIWILLLRIMLLPSPMRPPVENPILPLEDDQSRQAAICTMAGMWRKQTTPRNRVGLASMR